MKPADNGQRCGRSTRARFNHGRTEQIKELLGTLRVDGWENFEKLVYIKLLIEKLIAAETKEG